MLEQKQGHVVAQAALAGLVLLVAAAWLAALLLLPVCWLGLGGPAGCAVSGLLRACIWTSSFEMDVHCPCMHSAVVCRPGGGLLFTY
jgi:hypothetical protein